MPYSDAGNQSLLAMGFPERFWNRLGATRVERSICGPTVGAGVKMTLGHDEVSRPIGDPSLEVDHPVGHQHQADQSASVADHRRGSCQRRHSRRARPIRTVTADAADWFIQPLPGTDIALMLAIMHVLIRDGLTDKQWIADHTLGFEQLALHVDEWTPERAAATCGVAAADIERLAEMYGTIRPAVIRTLIGAEHHENGAMFFRTLSCLPAIVGAWRDRGGGLARSVGVWSGSIVDGKALERPDLLGDRQPRWVNMSRLGRDPDRDHQSCDQGPDGVGLQSLGDHAEQREDPCRGAARRPVHGRARAVHHRYRALRRHRAAGDDPDRIDGPRDAVGPPLGELERGGDRALW